MPASCPPRALVTIHPLDANTWVVRRQLPEKKIKMIAIPIIQELPDDPKWEKLEEKIARHAVKNLPPFEE